MIVVKTSLSKLDKDHSRRRKQAVFINVNLDLIAVSCSRATKGEQKKAK
jgi:hypothetical protein